MRAAGTLAMPPVVTSIGWLGTSPVLLTVTSNWMSCPTYSRSGPVIVRASCCSVTFVEAGWLVTFTPSTPPPPPLRAVAALAKVPARWGLTATSNVSVWPAARLPTFWVTVRLPSRATTPSGSSSVTTTLLAVPVPLLVTLYV